MKQLSKNSDEQLQAIYQNCVRAIIEEKPFVKEAETLIIEICSELKRRMARLDSGFAHYDTPEVGMLSTVGYRVGNYGEKLHIRRKLLEVVMTRHLPFVGSLAYTAAWGEPLSTQRYRKLINTLCGFIENARNNPAQALACQHWEEDLAHVQHSWGGNSNKH